MENCLPRSNPEAQGIASMAVLDFVKDVEAKGLELHSFMLLRHGFTAAEGWWKPYGPEIPHMLFSLSKSFTSTAVGLAVSEGLLSVEDTLVSFFPEDAPRNPKDHLSSMRIKHLLSMASGHAEDTTERLHRSEDGNWIRTFLSLPVEYEPGTYFLYNSGATYMLSAVIQKVTGQSLLEYLEPRLFRPLGIIDAAWETCPRGINTGGWGLSIKTEDIAKFGQLYLQKGLWNGAQILPAEWVEEATKSHISNGDNENSDWAQGYGYQFWRCRHHAYRGDGAFGQFCIVMPEQDAVLAITSGLDNMQAVLDLVWKHLLPGIQEGLDLLPDSSAQVLEEKLHSLKILPPRILDSSPVQDNVMGSWYEMEDNPAQIQRMFIDFKDDAYIFIIHDHRGQHRIIAGSGEWYREKTALPGKEQLIEASTTWKEDHTLVITCRYIETPFYDTVTINFKDDKIRVKTSTNVSFGHKEGPSMLGIRKNV